MTLPALDQQQAAAQLPALVVAATGAAETVRPALLEQPPGTVDSGTRRNGLSKADLDVSAKLPE